MKRRTEIHNEEEDKNPRQKHRSSKNPQIWQKPTTKCQIPRKEEEKNPKPTKRKTMRGEKEDDKDNERKRKTIVIWRKQ